MDQKTDEKIIKTEKETVLKETKHVPTKKAVSKESFGKVDEKKVSDKTTSEKEHSEKSVFVKKKSQFSDYKLFNRWSFDDVVVSDLSLIRYVNLDPVVVPHSFGRKTRGRVERQNLNIVDRLINKLMRSG
ncbi:MAG: hypothetical protein PHF68_01205, partial [Candidatus ainarchaeum sp.]|nr:hypothetical protein [Candidatus ainarchaeum sp.]